MLLLLFRHTSRFLVCWLTCLPFCVADSMGWMTVPIAVGLAFFLFGIEEIGVQIEEPFGILALEVSDCLSICGPCSMFSSWVNV